MNAETVAIYFQAAALIFFAGANWAMLRDHSRRINAVEKKSDETALKVAVMEGELR